MFCGMLRRVARVITDVSEELSASIIRMEALSSSETSAITRATRHNNPEDAILHNYRHEILKSYMERCMLGGGGLQEEEN
jgi:hypothetical protein